jgi:hypothetical protein
MLFVCPENVCNKLHPSRYVQQPEGYAKSTRCQTVSHLPVAHSKEECGRCIEDKRLS